MYLFAPVVNLAEHQVNFVFEEFRCKNKLNLKYLHDEHEIILVYIFFFQFITAPILNSQYIIF